MDNEELCRLQGDSLKKFRELLSDVLQAKHNDIVLLKFLRVQRFDLQKAEKMFRENQDWRIKYGIDHIFEMWDPPEKYKVFDRGNVGNDKKGNPVLIFPLGRWDMKGLLSSCLVEDYALYMVVIVERMWLEARKMEEKTGYFPQSSTVILDMEGFDHSTLFWKPVWQLAIFLSHIFSANYPLSMSRLFAINCLPVAPYAYYMLKPLLNESVSSVLQVFSSDKSKWLPAILEVVDENQLPKHWGGTCVDPDGDPFCPSKVCLGIEFPKDEYMAHMTSLIAHRCSEKVQVPNGSAVEVNVEVEDEGVTLSWAFYTDGYNIDFMVHREGDTYTEEVIPKRRIESYFTLVEGSVLCTQPGNYIVTFDNSYYKLRSKNIWYSMEISSP